MLKHGNNFAKSKFKNHPYWMRQIKHMNRLAFVQVSCYYQMDYESFPSLLDFRIMGQWILPTLFVWVWIALSHSFSCFLRNFMWQDWPTIRQQTVIVTRTAATNTPMAMAHTAVTVDGNCSNIKIIKTNLWLIEFSAEKLGGKCSDMQNEKWISDCVYHHTHTKYCKKWTPGPNCEMAFQQRA